MRVPRAGERRSGRLRGRGECARGVQVVAGEEDRWGAGNSPVEPPVGISDQGNLLSCRVEQGEFPKATQPRNLIPSSKGISGRNFRWLIQVIKKNNN